MERYVEALSDASSGLTYPVLVGSRKQSVLDAERLFSPSLALFMEKNKYDFEANYIKILWNWRRSCDERGLTELQRCRYNYELLNYVLDELIPWHNRYDFSTLEVNRYVVCSLIIDLCHLSNAANVLEIRALQRCWGGGGGGVRSSIV